MSDINLVDAMAAGGGIDITVDGNGDIQIAITSSVMTTINGKVTNAGGATSLRVMTESGYAGITPDSATVYVVMPD